MSVTDGQETPRRRSRVAVAMVVVLVLASTAIPAEPEANESLWPTARMVQLIAERVVDDHALRYGLDEHQTARFRQQIVELIPTFLEKHRKVLEPVIVDVLVQHISGEVPTPEVVAGWAQKVLPILKEGVDKWDGAYQHMRPHLRPAQRRRWGRDHFYAKLGLSLAQAKLRSFAAGGFDPREWHQPLPGPYLEDREIISKAKKAGLDTTLPPDLISGVAAAIGVGRTPTQSPAPVAGPSRPQQREDDYVPLDKWESYTKQFIKRFQLDEGQQTAAMAVLKEMRERATSYRDAHRQAMRQAEKDLRSARGQARGHVQAELNELQAPLDRMFEEFRARLDGLLTESQRRLSGSAR